MRDSVPDDSGHHNNHMSSPVVPSDVKSIIPSVNGNFCQKFTASLALPKLMSDWFSYMYTESGEFTADFIADICAVGCVGTGDGTGGGGTGGGGTGVQAPLIFATDGDLLDRVRITWNSISGATSYDIYRSSTNNSATAVPIKTGELTTAYEDEDVEVGIYYYYWAKTRTLSGISNFSNGDRGHAGAVVTSLDTITTLDASKGFSYGIPGKVWLMWDKVNGAQTYDIYWNTDNDFASADLLDSNRIPYNNEESLSNGTAPYIVDNGTEIYYQHTIGIGVEQYRTYYYWVIARRSDPDAVSLPSNVGTGWAVGNGSGGGPTGGARVESSKEYTIQAGITSCFCALFGSGGGGAGGSTNYGGGAGGGGGIIVGNYPVVAGAKFRVRSNPEANTTNAVNSTDGEDGPETFLEYSALGDWSDTVTVASIGVPGQGAFNSSGGGVGGAGSTATNVGLTDSFDWDGRAGNPGEGSDGGRGGYRFGRTRQPAAHFNGFNDSSTFLGNGSSSAGGSVGAGSGSSASPTSIDLAVGGDGGRGYAVIAPYLQ